MEAASVLTSKTKKHSDYEEALKEGEDDVAYARVMFLGKEGSGKTSLLDGLMGLPFKEGRDSTSLAESRDVKYEWVEIEGGEGGCVWRERSKEDELSELAIRSQRVAQINAEAQDEEHCLTDSEEADELSDSINEAVTTLEVQSISEAYQEHTDDVCAKARELEERMSSKESPDVLHVWDCGGQPIFLDILSVFITMRTFFFLVFNAAEDIHAPCKESVWRHKGRKIQGRKRNISVIQLLVQWMQLIYSIVGSSSSTRNVMLIGTHGDKLREREGVLKSLDSACSEKSFYQIVLKRLIIDNTTSGRKQGEDREYGVIREKISEFSKTQTTRTPLRWISFRSVIMKEVGSKVFVLSRAKVDKIATTCNIRNVESVLDFYHQLGVFLFFREACPDTVFIDPHWLFQNICVLLMPQCYNELNLNIPPSLQMYLDKYGIMSNDFYQIASQKCGLKANDLIQILDHFDLVKEMPADQITDVLRGITGTKFFFVPCTLKNIIDRKQRPGRVQAATLHIVFKDIGCVPPGFFIRLAALMAKREKFELHLKSDQGIYRDYIPFKYNKTLQVTIFEPPSIDSVHVDIAIDKKMEKELAPCCSSLRNELYELCKEASGRWLSSIDVNLAFQCEECLKENETCFMYLSEAADECSVCESCMFSVSDAKEYSCWLPSTEVPTSQPTLVCHEHGRPLLEANSDNSHARSIASERHTDLSSSQARPTRKSRETHSPVLTTKRQKLSSELIKPNLALLTQHLKNLTWADVKLVAIQLGVEYSTLKRIKEEHDAISERVLSAMDSWLNSDPEASWMKVVDALIAIEKNVLAKELKEKYCTPHLP